MYIHNVPFLICTYISDRPNKQVKGDPKATIFVARLNPTTTEGYIYIYIYIYIHVYCLYY